MRLVISSLIFSLTSIVTAQECPAPDSSASSDSPQAFQFFDHLKSSLKVARYIPVKKNAEKNYETRCYYGYQHAKTGLITIKEKKGHLRNLLKNWDFSFCLSKDKESSNQDLLWFFHGALGTAETWNRYQSLIKIREEWRKEGHPLPSVISYSQGRVANFLDRDRLKNFFQHLVSIEKFIGWEKTPSNRRLGVGFSMGGRNVIEISYQRPELFQRILVSSPALVQTRHHWTQKQRENYLITANTLSPYQEKNRGADSRIVKIMQLIPLNDQLMDQYDPNIQPQEKLSSIKQKFPETMVMAVDKDMYGFGVGSWEWSKNLSQAGIKGQYHLFKGGHCGINPSLAAHFLIRSAHPKPTAARLAHSRPCTSEY